MKINSNPKVLLIEPPGDYIRLDRCMQSTNSWGGVYRFPLSLARIGAELSQDYIAIDVRFIDLQADHGTHLEKTLREFKPDVCILSCGFPSMRQDAATAAQIKKILPRTHVSTFGVVPTLLEEKFFSEKLWGFPILFDSVVIGGEPATKYYQLVYQNQLKVPSITTIYDSKMDKKKKVWTLRGRNLFNHSLYRSPFNGEIQTYIEGSYGCPKKCDFCVVPELYGGNFAQRSAKDIVTEFEFVIERNGVQQISLWDEGTTFQRSQVAEICQGLIELRKSNIPAFKNFTWNTRSTTALVTEDLAMLMKESGLTGLTLGIESFDDLILSKTNKGTTIADNENAIRILRNAGIISIGHIVLGLPDETDESVQYTIATALESDLDLAQFYCAVPYPGTVLHKQASEAGLIRVTDLTKYELCNPIMDTLGGLTHIQVGVYRKEAMRLFYEKRKNPSIQMLGSKNFTDWSNR